MENPGDFVDDPKNLEPGIHAYKFLSAMYGMKAYMNGG